MPFYEIITFQCKLLPIFSRIGLYDGTFVVSFLSTVGRESKLDYICTKSDFYMITNEQIKDLSERRDALRRFL